MKFKLINDNIKGINKDKIKHKGIKCRIEREEN